jgi:hypothetical protein
MTSNGVPTPQQRQHLEDSQDHDILVALGVDMIWMKKQFSNHLAHHTKYEVALIVAIVLMVIKDLVIN